MNTALADFRLAAAFPKLNPLGVGATDELSGH